jgi:hypothetical protein
VSQVEAFHAAAQQLDSAGIVWWLSDGSALGAIRDNKFIGTDPDVDLGIWWDDLPDVLEAFAGWQRVDGQDLKYQHSGVRVDIHPHVRDRDGVWFPLGLKGSRYRYRFPGRLFDRFDPVTFYGRDVQVPSPAADYLQDHYGPDWRTPKLGWRWDQSPPCLETIEPSGVSVTIMAHPKRQAWAEQLAEQLGCPVVWDRRNVTWDTARRAWLAHDPTATHHLVVQDDAILSADLQAAATRVANVAGPIPVSLTTIGYRIRQGRRNYDLVANNGHSFWLSDRGISTVALMIPTTLILGMIADCDLHSSRHDDVRIMAWLRNRNIKTAFTIPSLIDHRDVDVNPSLVPGNGVGMASRAALNFIGADRSGSEVLWRPPGRKPRPAKTEVNMPQATFVRKGDPEQTATVEVGSNSYYRLRDRLSWAWELVSDDSTDPDPVVEVPELGQAASGPVALGGGWYDVAGERIRGKGAAEARHAEVAG